MKECAFCDHRGKLSFEHVVSKWMEKLFPGDLQIHRTNQMGQYQERKSDKIDWKEKVVCEPCNNTWMSRIEDKHAQPVMTPLITGEIGIPIGPIEARALAMFAFKTAVVLDHASNEIDHFFSREARHAFREKQAIPPTVQMWLAGFAHHRGGGRFKTFYHQGQLSASGRLKMYVCTCAIGNFAFQVVAAKSVVGVTLDPLPGFESLAVPLLARSLPRIHLAGSGDRRRRAPKQRPIRFLRFALANGRSALNVAALSRPADLRLSCVISQVRCYPHE